MDRRDFLKQSALASSLYFVPSFVRALEDIPMAKYGFKKLVVIQLDGGNDGLNTVIPYRNDHYFKARPSLAISDNILPLNDDLALHESLMPLKNLYDEGYLSIINNVGYPNPIRSHFRATDIWHSASDSNKFFQTGWIGRYLDTHAKKPYNAIEINESLSMMLKGHHNRGIATQNFKTLYRSSNNPYFKSVLEYYNDKHLSEHNLGYLYKTMLSAKSSASYIYENTKIKLASVEYPRHAFGKQMRTIAQFINSGLDTSVYYASLNGFDTHANQKGKQKHLLQIYADSMAAFIEDLKDQSTFRDTLVLTFSEFGRRVNQNASNGTDHGSANNVFIIAEDLKTQGLYNNLASLDDLDDNGDLKYEIDFRNIYATILDKWLEVDDESILTRSFDTLDFI